MYSRHQTQSSESMTKIRIPRRRESGQLELWYPDSDIDIIGQNNILLQRDGHILLHLM